MFGFGGKNNRRGPIGIALTAQAVYLAQRGPRGGFIFASQELPEGTDPAIPTYHTEVSRAIAATLRSIRFAGKQAVSALPAEMLQYKTLRLPPMPEEDLTQAVAWEAAERFQVGDDQVLQHYNAGEVHQGNEIRQEMILLAADRATVYDHASSVKRAGLLPIAIDATGGALVRVLGPGADATVVIHLGEHTAEIVGARGGRVIFDKPIALVKENDTIDAGALARELGLCLRYMSVTFGVHQPDALWGIGQGATPQFLEQLSSGLAQPVLPAARARALSGIDFPEADPSRWLVSLGLAMRDEHDAVERGAA